MYEYTPEGVFVEITPKGVKALAEVKKSRNTRIKKEPPKMIKCNVCWAMIEDIPNRQICHWCRSPYWKKPTLKQRFNAMIKGFWKGR